MRTTWQSFGDQLVSLPKYRLTGSEYLPIYCGLTKECVLCVGFLCQRVQRRDEAINSAMKPPLFKVLMKVRVVSVIVRTYNPRLFGDHCLANSIGKAITAVIQPFFGLQALILFKVFRYTVLNKYLFSVIKSDLKSTLS